MRWALWILGGIAAVIAVISIIGMLLPRDHVATRSAKFRVSVDSVWAALVDTKDYPRWRSDVVTMKELPAVDGKRSWMESGKGNSIRYVAEREEKPRTLVTRIENEDLPFGGSWNYQVEPDGSGARLTITENGWVSNPIFRFVSRFVLGHSATMDTYLRALGKRFGEDVTPG